MKEKSAMKDVLIQVGLSSEKSIVPFFPKVRDRDDVSVLKCEQSGVIFLNRIDHMNMQHYAKKEGHEYWGGDRKTAVLSGLEDNQRRFEQFKLLVANKKWLDVGTGCGAILDLLSPLARETVAVEPQQDACNHLKGLGYKAYSSIDQVQENGFDVVTLFHVFEHITDPVGVLKSLRNKMAKGGKIIIEVPHARDFLISFLENEAFKSFTFWSEHLILHTRESLEIFLKTAEFSQITIKGVQRYPLANHLYWLSHGKPGGHLAWQELRTPELELAYSNMLNGLDKNDTLVAVAGV